MRDSASSAGFDLWEAVDGIREAIVPKVAARMGRGDIRTAILLALAEEPMHGYQVIQSIETRSRGAWKPSPGSIYPTLQLLADEGLVTSEQVGERKVYSLTDAGRAVADDASDEPHPSDTRRPWNDERAALPKAGAKLASAIGQVVHSGSSTQAESATAVIDEARRKIYAILAED
jgi:DNA-binding PadR family transcriptional regulator